MEHPFIDCIWTLTLGILGSSCLPVAFAFSNVGLCFGIILTLIVAFAHSYTGTIILKASHVLHTSTYEDMCEAVSRSVVVKRLSELSLFLLLFGTQCSSASLLGDCSMATLRLFNGVLPSWMLDDSRCGMVLLTLGVVLPLSLKKQMRSLDTVAALGTALVVILCGIIMYSSILSGFPALKSGDFPIISIKNVHHVPESISILSFAFYLQPLLLPLRSEMPPGDVGLKMTCRALKIVTIGIALTVYVTLGVFAAMRYGHETEGDVLLNHWIPRSYQPILEISMAIYLSSSVAPVVLAMRYLIYAAQGREENSISLNRHIATTVICVSIPTLVAGLYPKQSQVLFSITGATAVCLIAYVFPIYVHLSLYLRRAGSAESFLEGLTEQLVSTEGQAFDTGPMHRYPHIKRVRCMSSRNAQMLEIVTNLLLPIAILTFGVCASIMALMAMYA